MSGISSGPVSQSEALAAANELEEAIMECLNGQRKAGKLPVEPMVRLAQFARDAAAERQAQADEIATLKLQLEAGPLYSTRLKAKRYDWLREQAEPNRGGEKPWCTVRDGKGYAWAMGGALDAAIDAAIAKDKPA